MSPWRRASQTAFCAIFCAAVSTIGLAVEPAPIKIGERWSVVGVISGDSGAAGEVGIAVLRNNSNNRTYTLTIGDGLPSEFGFTLQSVRGKNVVVSDGQKAFTLSFADAPVEETEAVSKTARFIDNYYRSVGEGRAENGYAPTTGEGAATTEADLRYDTERAGRSRFELYREERHYRPLDSVPGEDRVPVDAEDSEDAEGDGFVVNYDNFSDETGEAYDEDGDAGLGAAEEYQSTLEDVTE